MGSDCERLAGAWVECLLAMAIPAAISVGAYLPAITAIGRCCSKRNRACVGAHGGNGRQLLEAVDGDRASKPLRLYLEDAVAQPQHRLFLLAYAGAALG